MSIVIVEPAFTPESLVAIFSHLCNHEVKKRLAATPGVAHHEGIQTGYINCLIDMFGEAPDKELIKAFDAKQSWIHFVDRMIDTHLTNLMDSLEDVEIGITEFAMIDDEVKNAAKSFVLNNINDAKTAVSNL